jgi:hypothetical protein
VTRLSALRRLAPLALAATAALSCSTSKTPTGGNNSDFTLELIWLGTAPTGATLASFEGAADIVRETITGALGTVALPNDFTNLSDCGLPGHPDIGRSNIQGLRIYLVVEPIDGASGTLGSAGPCLIRLNNIPALGVMRFDEADVANLQAAGRLERVALHEMMHVLGLGTVWYDQFVDTLPDTTNVRYTGALARNACVNVNGGATPCATTIPIESADGPGSRYSHWRESVFQTELMTPRLGFAGSTATPFAAMSIRALEDIGYEVSTVHADAFTVPAPAAAMLRERAADDLVLPEPMQPRWKLDGAGRRTPYRPRR